MKSYKPTLAALALIAVAACSPADNQGTGTSTGSTTSTTATSGSGGHGGSSGTSASSTSATSSSASTSGSGGTAGAGTGGSGTGGSGTGGSPTDGGTGGSAGDGQAPGDCTAALPNSLFCDPYGPMPMSIKATGIFPSAPDFTKHSPSMREYVPDPPLWSDGMEKQRFLLLPPGAKIDNSDRTNWQFPPGTIFIKTFFDDSGAGGKSRAIETRFIRKAKQGSVFPYEYYLYQWNADGTDATLVVNNNEGDTETATPVMITIKRTENGQPFMINAGKPFQHDLPARSMCGKCHEEAGMVGQTFIGFDELRLNSKFSSTSAKTQLQEFADAGIFTGPIPANPATITDASNDMGRLLRIKKFVFGNCVHCHNGNSVFDMHPDVLVANTVNKATEAQSVSPPAGWKRIVPKSPGTSVVYVQTQRTMIPPPVGNLNRLRPMPPVGVADVAADQAALKDLYDWIMSL
jgi:hypothetical protein